MATSIQKTIKRSPASAATEGLTEVSEELSEASEGLTEVPADDQDSADTGQQPEPAERLSTLDYNGEVPVPISSISSKTIPENPKPSTPVVEAVRKESPAAKEGAMHFLGAFSLPDQLIVGGCALPLVVFNNGVPVGVVAVSDPGVIGKALHSYMVEAGYTGELEIKQAHELPAHTRLAAARACAAAKGNLINRGALVAAFGFSVAQLG